MPDEDPRRGGPKPDLSTIQGVVGPVLLVCYAVFTAYCVRGTRGWRILTDEGAFWYAVPLFGLALFFHARYFALYRRVPLVRGGLMAIAVGVIVYGIVRFPPRSIAPN